MPTLRGRPVSALVLFLLLFLSACVLGGGGDEEAARRQRGDQAQLQGQATLVCNNACSERGQCGTRQDGVKAVFLSNFQPATINHTLAIEANTAVTIREVRQQELVNFRNQQEVINLNYYLVDLAGGGAGWVAGWCLVQ